MKNDTFFKYKKVKPLLLEYLANIHNNKINDNSRKTQSQTYKIYII